jgi:hypothetical protein
MSSEAIDRTVATRKRRNKPTQYWTFFPKDDRAFWNFVDRSREDVPVEEASAQPTAITSANGSPDIVKYSTAECVSASLRDMS